MKISRLEIQNFKGIESLTIEPKTLVKIVGENGVGKSSVLDALRDLFEGGHHPEHIRLGAKKAEIVLTLDDGAVAKKTITPKGTTVSVTTATGEPVKAPQGYINELAGGFGFDPLAFVTAKPKERLAFLLEAMPIAFSVDELRACGPDLSLWRDQSDALVLTSERALAEVDGIRQTLYDKRAVLNRDAKQLDGGITTMRRSLPPKSERHALQEESALKAELAAADEQVDVAEKAASAYMEGTIAAARAIFDAAATKARQDCALALARIGDVARPERARLVTAITEARKAADEESRAAGMRDLIEKQVEQYRAKTFEADRLTTAIEAMDELKRKKLEALPIPGVEIKDGEIYLDGVPFDEVNTAGKMMLAVQIGSLNQGALGLMVCDDAEHMDQQNWRDFEAAVISSGMQVFAARVDAGPLRVEQA